MTFNIEPEWILSIVGTALGGLIEITRRELRKGRKATEECNTSIIKLDKTQALMQKDITAALQAAKKSEETWTKLTLVRASAKRAHQRIDTLERKGSA